ncbi:NAD(P)-dependent oxidoreductase [Dactylosporangium sp. NBC_01737]|uniref:NAD-dependent epimerase/dehydratase family protein n=1 Tax=Dactylosporangium sp. NBC_01737 TaxID=2975959 RepID=UPI002E13A7B4|nr:NAD(P)-dependent oxidoreductase [Dactylosporangium sp. NBC_01737]
MRVVVTGAAGNIGRAVVARLHAAAVDVVALALEAVTGTSKCVVGSAGDPDVVAEAFEGQVDAVIHLAAIPAPTLGTALDVFTGNTRATFVVLDEAARRGVPRAVLASSYALLGMPFSPHDLHPPYYPLDEQAPPQVEDPYALSKLVDELTGEMFHRRHGMDVVALRFPFTGGTQRLAKAAADVRADPELGARNSWAYLHVDDAAEAAWLAASRPLTGFHRVFLAAPDTFAAQPTEELIAAYHKGVPVRAAIAGRRVPIDTGAAERLLGFRPAYRIPE